MNFWLFKSEPEEWSWQAQVKKGAKGEPWTGVRNYQANANMKAMKTGDFAFFYHSGAEKSIVGIVRVIREHYPDKTDESGRFGCVDVEVAEAMPTPVTLAEIKTRKEFADFLLVRQGRLSVVPVDKKQWTALCKMGGLKTIPGI
jgi:predicted RNA-binding protein with PUA-like domain